MKRILPLSMAAMVCSALTLGDTPPPESTVALVSKVVQDVTRMEVGGQWDIAKRGQTLGSGARVRTGTNSLAVVKFKDNSMVRLRENSEMTVGGQTDGDAFSKTVEVVRGAVGFNVKKQQPAEEFRFTSPTSVASIRGTGGQFGVEDTADVVTLVEGFLRLTNNISMNGVDVEGGFTGISYPDGRIETRLATDDETRNAALSSRSGEQNNQIEFELRDSQGNTKRLKIDYR